MDEPTYVCSRSTPVPSCKKDVKSLHLYQKCSGCKRFVDLISVSIRSANWRSESDLGKDLFHVAVSFYIWCMMYRLKRRNNMMQCLYFQPGGCRPDSLNCFYRIYSVKCVILPIFSVWNVSAVHYPTMGGASQLATGRSLVPNLSEDCQFKHRTKDQTKQNKTRTATWLTWCMMYRLEKRINMMGYFLSIALWFQCELNQLLIEIVSPASQMDWPE